jgi:hypothetical protein
MGNTLYHFYSPEHGNRVFAGFFKERPEFSIDLIVDGELDPVYDVNTNSIYDAADPEELIAIKRKSIEKIDEEYTDLISKYLKRWLEKKSFGDIEEYPDEVFEERDRLRAECNEKIAALGVDVSVYRESKRREIILIK